MPQTHSVESAFRRLSETAFASIVTIAADAIICIDSSQQIIFFNEGAVAIFGWQPEEILGRRLELLIPERYRASHEAHVTRFGRSHDHARRMGERSAISGLRRNGEEFPAEASISRVTVEGEPLYTVVLRDITERTRSADRARFLAEASEALAHSLDLSETLDIVARLPVPAFADAAVVEFAIVGGVLTAAGHPEPAAREALAAARAGIHRPAPDAAGAWLPPEASALRGAHLLHVPLFALDAPRGAVTLLRTRAFDEDDRALAADFARRAALALTSARLHGEVQAALRLRDDMSAIVSHDLRNPVQAIRMLAGAISSSAILPVVIEQATIIQQAADQMDALIQDLLDAARIDRGGLRVAAKPEPAAPLVEGALEQLYPLAEARGQALTVEIGEGLPTVMADAGRVAQVLSNLVGNAIKFTPDGGRITVTVRAVRDGVEVAVTDTGPGIPEEQRERVFDRYVQLRRGRHGAGLGLAIAKGIVEAHGGRIWQQPAPGGGSIFAFTLPAAAG